MKSKILTSLFALSVAGSNLLAGNWTEGMKDGTPAFKSMGPLAFGPDAILFVADTKSAAIFAIALDDKKAGAAGKPLKIEAINQKVAALLGTSADQVLIDDMIVNPVSRNVYLAVSRGRGPDATPVLIRTKPSGDLEVVGLEKVKFAK